MSTKKLLSGNEAIALGAWEAGVALGCGYPGTPSTEIIEALFNYHDVYTEWSVNEKVALEVGLGASLAGGRALVTMKHVGVNVAADPLFTAVYTGVNAGLVVVTADDPSMHSSQNEQDNRNYAVAAKMPMLEPCDAEEARLYTRAAFELSERFDTPVFLRTTTRLSHSKGVVTAPAEGTVPERHPIGFEKNPPKYVMIPGHAKRRRFAVEDRWKELVEAVETHPANRIEHADGPVGVITSGIPYTYVKEVLPDAAVLKLGVVHPLPRRMIEEFAARYPELYVIEELDPVIETQVRAWGIDVVGKDRFPNIGEFSPDVLRRAFGLNRPDGTPVPAVAVPPRLPELCPGCPHGQVFHTLREHDFIVSGDIGCYSLGVLPPYSAMDTLVDMGASLTMAQGMDAVYAHDPTLPAGGTGGTGGTDRAGAAGGGGGQTEGPSRPKIAAVIGDSTFAHSGLTGLLNACWNKREGLYIVLDNGTTAMTGMQPNPMSGERIGREDTFSLDYGALAKAFNIPAENYLAVDARDNAAIVAGIESLVDKPGIRLLAVIGMCVIEAKELRKVGKLDDKRERRRIPVSVDEGSLHG